MLALREIANCVAELIIVFATNNRKILLYVLFFLFSDAQMMAFIISLVALKQDLFCYYLE